MFQETHSFASKCECLAAVAFSLAFDHLLVRNTAPSKSNQYSIMEDAPVTACGCHVVQHSLRMCRNSCQLSCFPLKPNLLLPHAVHPATCLRRNPNQISMKEDMPNRTVHRRRHARCAATIAFPTPHMLDLRQSAKSISALRSPRAPWDIWKVVRLSLRKELSE